MGSRFLRDEVNQAELKFSDHCDLDDVAIYINPIEGNIDYNQVGMCCVVKRADLEKLMWWHNCSEGIDLVDSCIKSLGIVLNIAENCMNYDLANTEAVVQAVRDDYRKLSDAILMLRGQKEGEKDAKA